MSQAADQSFDDVLQAAYHLRRAWQRMSMAADPKGLGIILPADLRYALVTSVKARDHVQMPMLGQPDVLAGVRLVINENLERHMSEIDGVRGELAAVYERNRRLNDTVTAQAKSIVALEKALADAERNRP